MEEIGGTLIYQGDPFAHTSHLSAWAYAGDQISVQLYDKAIQFYDAKMVQFQFKVKTDLVKTGNYGPMVVGFVGDDQFGLSSGFCTGADRTVLDPGGNYRNQEAYRNKTSGTSYRGNRGNEDFAFPEDFQWYSSSYTYGASISANSVNFQYGRSFGLTQSSTMGSTSYPDKFQEHKSGTYTLNVIVNPSRVQYMYPYGSSLTSVRLTNMQTIRPVIGLLTGADSSVSSPPKFKILESSLTIYACK